MVILRMSSRSAICHPAPRQRECTAQMPLCSQPWRDKWKLFLDASHSDCQVSGKRPWYCVQTNNWRAILATRENATHLRFIWIYSFIENCSLHTSNTKAMDLRETIQITRPNKLRIWNLAMKQSSRYCILSRDNWPWTIVLPISIFGYDHLPYL